MFSCDDEVCDRCSDRDRKVLDEARDILEYRNNDDNLKHLIKINSIYTDLLEIVINLEQSLSLKNINRKKRLLHKQITKVTDLIEEFGGIV
tara:strand:+ start:469 stop:741 length:273 start_codon:yes stop_codon:yes gene_type:complete